MSLLGKILLLLGASCFQLPTYAQAYTWKSVNLQGMGFVTGLIAHPLNENLVFAKTDVGGIYRWNPSDTSWTPLLDGKKIPFEIESIAISPADTNWIFLATDSSIYASSDKGNNWKKEKLPVGMNGNGDWRQAGERLVVDPNGGSKVFFFGSRKNGLWKSTTLGSKWIHVDEKFLPSGADAGISFVVFDKSSGNASNASNRIFVGVMGFGIYQSNDGGVKWTLLTNGPGIEFRPISGTVASDGDAFFTYASQPYGGVGSVYVYDGNSLKPITPQNTAGKGFCGLSVDPTNSKRLLTLEFNAGPEKALHLSIDGGISWRELTLNNGSQNYLGPKNVFEPPYYPGWSSFSYSGTALIDAVGRGWFTTGFAIYRCENLSVPVPLWKVVMKNFEELVVNVLKTPPVSGGAELVSGVADMIGFVHSNTANVPEVKIMPESFGYMSGLAYCESSPSIMAFVGSDEKIGTCKAQISGDNGQSWKDFGSIPIGAFNGNIAISATDPTRMVWAPLAANWTSPANVKVHFSIDGGKTWQACNGLPNDNAASLQWSASQFLVADKVNGKTFYYYNPGYFPAPTGVLYRSLDGGENWEQIFSGLPEVWKMKLETRPGKEGDLWFATGQDEYLRHSIDGGKSWEILKNVSAKSVGFGKSIAPSVETTIYIYGIVAGKLGAFRSMDMGTNWSSIATDNLPDIVTDITGDMRFPGRVFIATAGRGVFRGEETTFLKVRSKHLPTNCSSQKLNSGVNLNGRKNHLLVPTTGPQHFVYKTNI